MRKKLYTTRMVADLLRVSVKTVHRERSDGKINYIRLVGGKICYREADVFRYLEDLETRIPGRRSRSKYICQGGVPRTARIE